MVQHTPRQRDCGRLLLRPAPAGLCRAGGSVGYCTELRRIGSQSLPFYGPGTDPQEPADCRRVGHGTPAARVLRLGRLADRAGTRPRGARSGLSQGRRCL